MFFYRFQISMLDMFLPWYVISLAVNTSTTKSGFSGVLKYCSNIGFQYFFLVATSSWILPFALISTYGSENSLPDQIDNAVSEFFFSCSTLFRCLHGRTDKRHVRKTGKYHEADSGHLAVEGSNSSDMGSCNHFQDLILECHTAHFAEGGNKSNDGGKERRGADVSLY